MSFWKGFNLNNILKEKMNLTIIFCIGPFSAICQMQFFGDFILVYYLFHFSLRILSNKEYCESFALPEITPCDVHFGQTMVSRIGQRKALSNPCRVNTAQFRLTPLFIIINPYGTMLNVTQIIHQLL